ncbi:MAG: hypothetical protein CM15mP120_28500 [Pseudomonadota bacterium]|nr:MAG: hypothetical protein CM15mP120_28500 [Pseudomonadota bacterium]
MSHACPYSHGSSEQPNHHHQANGVERIGRQHRSRQMRPNFRGWEQQRPDYNPSGNAIGTAISTANNVHIHDPEVATGRLVVDEKSTADTVRDPSLTCKPMTLGQ